MRELRRLAWSAAIAAIFSGSAFAQQQTGNTITSTGQTTGGNAGGNSLSQGGNNLSGNAQGTELMTVQQPPRINAPSTLTSTSTVINASNFLGKTYSNPQYMGYHTTYNYSATAGSPGGFGTALGGTTTGAQGAQGGRGGAGGVTGSVNSQDPGGVIVPLPVQISYPATLQFTVPVVSSQVLNDIRSGIDRSPAFLLTNPRAIQIVMDGQNVILRGSVKDNDEYRLVENVVRTTPGVRDIKNELVYPK